MAVCPSIANIAGMVVGDKSAVNDPTKSVGTTVGRDDGEARERIRDAVDGVIEIDGDGLDAREDLLHHGDKLAFPAGASTIVSEEHAVVLEEVAAHDFEFLLAQVDILLAGHIDHGGALTGWKALETTNLHGLGTIADGVAGADAVLGEKVEIGTAVHVLLPVATVVFQADEADLAPGCARREAGPIAFSLADFVEVFGDFKDLQFDVIDGRRIEEDAAIGINDVFLVDDLLNFDDLFKLGFLATAEWGLVEAASRESREDEGHQAKEEGVGEEREDGLAELVVLLAKIPGDELPWVPDELLVVWCRDAFCFSVDPPDGPGKANKEGSGGAKLSDGVSEGVGVVKEGEMGEELPNREIANAEDGSTKNVGGLPVAADPVVADGEGGEESEGKSPGSQPKPGVGIDPKQAPDERISDCQTGRPEKPCAESWKFCWSGHPGTGGRNPATPGPSGNSLPRLQEDSYWGGRRVFR